MADPAAPPPASIGITQAEAATMFETLLSEPSETEEGLADVTAETAEQAETTAPEDEAAQETPSEDEEVAAEDEGTADAEETEEKPDQGPQLVTVKVNGKTEQLPIDEVAKGYQRQADYSQKTADLADQRRAFEADRQKVQEERAQYAQLLSSLSDQLKKAEAEPDWQTLYDTNPLEYVRQKDLFRERQDRAAAAQYETQRLQQVQASEQQAALQKSVAEGRAKLTEAMPDWKDAKKWDADRVKLLDYGKKLGFTDQELSNTYDHRAVIALHKARLYDELVAKKPVAVVRKAPTALPAGSAQTVTARQTSDETRAKQRLAKTGSIRDAAAVFEKFL